MIDKLKALDSRLAFLTEHRRGVASKDKGEVKYVNKRVNETKYALSKLATEFLRNADQNDTVED
jgi:hypothetical protein